MGATCRVRVDARRLFLLRTPAPAKSREDGIVAFYRDHSGQGGTQDGNDAARIIDGTVRREVADILEVLTFLLEAHDGQPELVGDLADFNLTADQVVGARLDGRRRQHAKEQLVLLRCIRLHLAHEAGGNAAVAAGDGDVVARSVTGEEPQRGRRAGDALAFPHRHRFDLLDGLGDLRLRSHRQGGRIIAVEQGRVSERIVAAHSHLVAGLLLLEDNGLELAKGGAETAAALGVMGGDRGGGAASADKQGQRQQR